MDYIKDITEFHQNAIGVTFNFKTTQERDVHENVPSHPDYGSCIATPFTRTNFYATGFSFDYKGARISGALPEVDAGSVDDDMDYPEYLDLLPAVQKVCGFTCGLLADIVERFEKRRKVGFV